MCTPVTSRVYPKCATGHAITADPLIGGTGGRVILRPFNQNDEKQVWKRIFNNSPCFVLVNCATNQAIQSAGPGEDLRLTPYKGQTNDGMILWKSKPSPTDQTDGFCIIEPAGNNICWTVNKNNDNSYDGVSVRCDPIEQPAKDNQQWNFPHINTVTVRACPKCAPRHAITAELLMGGIGGKVILRPYNQNDGNQLLKLWERIEITFNNSPCFVLVNRDTYQAIQSAGSGKDLQLTPYIGQTNDVTILWKEKRTQSDQADVFRIVEPAFNPNNICWTVNKNNDNSYDGVSVRCDPIEQPAKDNQLWSLQQINNSGYIH